MCSPRTTTAICFYSVPSVMPGMFFWRVRRYGTKCLIEGRELLFYRQGSKFVIIFSRGVLVEEINYWIMY